MLILTINAGSSSIKYKAFSAENDRHQLLFGGLIDRIGVASGLWNHRESSQPHHFKNHQEAFEALGQQLKTELGDQTIQAVGHRVVHGGTSFYQPTLITPDVLAEINQLSQLAPLHNPINALGIIFAQAHFNNAVHVAIFDSGFHHTLPKYVRNYAIDQSTAKRYQIERYGFHGINHEYVAREAANYLNKPLPNCNFISLHLGNGASACLIKNGQSYDTSMGMTPLAGLIMGTRCGDIDPALPLYLLDQGLTSAEVDHLLNKQSGLKGICNDSDMRRVLARVEADDEAATLALEMYVYAIQKIIGAYLSQIDFLDALIFTGGVGENAAYIREKALGPLKHFGFQLNNQLNELRSKDPCYAISTEESKLVLVIRSDEESLMVQKVMEVI